MAEEKEEKEGIEWGELVGHAIRFLILTWSLSVISFAYFGNSNKQIDTTFAAGLLSAVMSNMGLQVKNNANGKKRPFNVVSNKDNKAGIK